MPWGWSSTGACSGPNCCGGNQLYTTQSTGPTYNCYYVTPNSLNTQGLQLQNAASRLRVLASPLAYAISFWPAVTARMQPPQQPPGSIHAKPCPTPPVNTGMWGLLEYSRLYLLRGFADSAYGVLNVSLTHHMFLFKFYILAFNININATHWESRFLMGRNDDILMRPEFICNMWSKRW